MTDEEIKIACLHMINDGKRNSTEMVTAAKTLYEFITSTKQNTLNFETIKRKE